jgi:aminoglycoside phosphotransferase family enzyme
MSLRGVNELKPRAKRRGRSNLLRIEGEGSAVEYAVKMRQLPQDRMLDVLLPQGQVSEVI